MKNELVCVSEEHMGIFEGFKYLTKPHNTLWFTPSKWTIDYCGEIWCGDHWQFHAVTRKGNFACYGPLDYLLELRCVNVAHIRDIEFSPKVFHGEVAQFFCVVITMDNGDFIKVWVD